MILKKITTLLKGKEVVSFNELFQSCGEEKDDLKQALEHLLLIHKIREIKPEKSSGCSCGDCKQDSCGDFYYEKYYRLV